MKRYLYPAILLGVFFFAGRIWTELGAHAGSGGAAIQNGDVNGDGIRDVSDAVNLLSYLFLGGPAPVAAGESGGQFHHSIIHVSWNRNDPYYIRRLIDWNIPNDLDQIFSYEVKPIRALLATGNISGDRFELTVTPMPWPLTGNWEVEVHFWWVDASCVEHRISL